LFGDLSVLDNVMLGRHSRMKNGILSSLLALPSTQRWRTGPRRLDWYTWIAPFDVNIGSGISSALSHAQVHTTESRSTDRCRRL